MMQETDQQPIPPDDNQAPRTTPHKIFRLVACVIIVIAALGTAAWLVKSKPKASRKPPVSLAPLVRTIDLESGPYQVSVMASGTIIPARQIVIKVPVAGEIIKVSPEFTEGGLLPADSEILRIDPTDYELLVRQKLRAVAEAEYASKLEEGRQEVARQEWKLLYGESDPTGPESDLAMRRPHLEKIRLDLEGAKAELEQAELDLTRTIVRSPFNALVLRKYVSLGSQVSAQEKLAEMIDTDVYWAQVTLPADRLKWLQIPLSEEEIGSKAQVYYRDNNVRQGRVFRLLADLSAEGRMARLLIAINDPVGREQGPAKPPLLLGEYVRVAIEGATLPEVFLLPRSALHNDRDLWLLNDRSQLEIRQVKAVWRDEAEVIVREGLRQGEKLIVSELATPVAGMTLRQETASETD